MVGDDGYGCGFVFGDDEGVVEGELFGCVDFEEVEGYGWVVC